MQEEVDEKVISLSVQTTRMTAGVLKAAIRKFLNVMDTNKQKINRMKEAEKTGRVQERGREMERLRQQKKLPHGRQTIKQMMNQGAQLTNIEITDNNIKSFDRVARKYGIDYSLKRDTQTTPPKYLVFFKAKDVDVMTAAFKEYAGVTLDKEKKPQKPSVRIKLQKAVQRKAKHRQRVKVKQKDRGMDR